MSTPLTDEQRDWDLRLNFEAVTKDRDKWMRLFEQAGRDAAAERERADREKARADALEDVIAKVRALIPPPCEDENYGCRCRYLDPDTLAALLPDDTKEADRG